GTIALEWLPVLAGLLALYVPSFISLLGKRWREDDYTYGPTVLGIVVWLVWRKRALLLDARRVDPAPAAGFALLGRAARPGVGARGHRVPDAAAAVVRRRVVGATEAGRLRHRRAGALCRR